MRLLSALFCTLLALGLSAVAGEGAPGPGQPGEPKTIEPNADGTLTLHSKHAYVNGKVVRYEPQPNKNTLGYWTKQEDWVHWIVNVKTPGTYTVQILQGCGKGSGGAEVEVSVGEQKLKFVVEDTGHFQNFKEREIGTFTFDKAGEITLAVKPQTKPGAAVMDLRQIVLVPKK